MSDSKCSVCEDSGRVLKTISRGWVFMKDCPKCQNPNAAALGKLGGSRNTAAQNEARRRNGRLGGRPKKKAALPTGATKLSSL